MCDDLNGSVAVVSGQSEKSTTSPRLFLSFSFSISVFGNLYCIILFTVNLNRLCIHMVYPYKLVFLVVYFIVIAFNFDRVAHSASLHPHTFVFPSVFWAVRNFLN